MGEDSLKSFFEDMAKDDSSPKKTNAVSNLYDALGVASHNYYSTAKSDDISFITDKISKQTGDMPVIFGDKIDSSVPKIGDFFEAGGGLVTVRPDVIDWGGKGSISINNVQLTPDSSGLGYNARTVNVDPKTGIQYNDASSWKYSRNVYSIDSSMATTVLAEVKKHIEDYYSFVKIKSLRDLELAFSKFHCHIAQTETEAIGVRIEKLSDGTFLAIN